MLIPRNAAFRNMLDTSKGELGIFGCFLWNFGTSMASRVQMNARRNFALSCLGGPVFKTQLFVMVPCQPKKEEQNPLFDFEVPCFPR